MGVVVVGMRQTMTHLSRALILIVMTLTTLVALIQQHVEHLRLLEQLVVITGPPRLIYVAWLAWLNLWLL